MTANEVCEALRQKLRDRWSEYSAEVLERPAEVIFERADEIAAAKFCYDQLTERVAFPFSQFYSAARELVKAVGSHKYHTRHIFFIQDNSP